MRVIYHYHPDTHHFLGAGLADPDPLDPGASLIPAHATTEPPPTVGDDEQVVFDTEAGGWRIDPTPQPAPIPPLTATQVEEHIKTRRDLATREGGYPVDHDGYIWWFHSDAYSLTQQLGLITAAMQVKAAGGDLNAPLIPVPWKTLSGARVPMTAALALKLLPASMVQQGAIFATADAKLVALEAAAEPESVNWREGWPAVFESPQP